METFVWDRHFTTGLERVDEQHHHLVDLINHLGESLIDHRMSDDTLQTVFAELADYAKYHFSEEEHLMQESNVDPQHLDQHIRHHAQFIEQVSRMWNARATMAHPAEILHRYLSSWLGFHILGEDQTMARQIELIRSGASPAAAYAATRTHKDNATAALLQALHNLYHVLSEQNRDLADANAQLEVRVAERTRALAEANAALVQANGQLEKISRTDGLLGIANRQCLNERLNQEWLRARRERTPLALLMLDADYFKLYNDTYGHQAGDCCLKAIAQAARSALHRPADTLARYGGEEIAVLLPNTELAGACVVAENIAAQLSAMHIPHSASPVADHVTVSIGVTTMVPNETNSVEQLIAAADRALYQAKHQGRNRVCRA
jgi:hemerythrin